MPNQEPMIKFIYLQVGSKERYQRELRHSISTLLAEIPEASGHIVIYTDNPSLYAQDLPHVTPCDISGQLAEMTQTANGEPYFFRAKPAVLLHALETYQSPCVFLDTDTFANRGFRRMLKRTLRRGAAMDKYLKRHPYPECQGLEVALPSGKTYRYDAKTSVIYNSGVIAVRPEHAAALRDAIVIMDAVRPLTMRAMDQEQFAVNEALRLHGARIGLTHLVLKHYHGPSQKRYMHWRFEQNLTFCPSPIVPSRLRVTCNKHIGWCFKQLGRYSVFGIKTPQL